ncbi:hypothetical protein BDZ90DRAFT_154339 [Jaminaea rosea]|uniref:Uncharacterized protein n=1 Tax=Jaminaea rosea TaxID=1569628 RepID=A0A316UTQ2_9BASI|nr:hypothetical protein BDZ90DRAFT_154339 [Jaminaea rosea]PWN28659.1 hypothetical protein BDZ90DRAFT_154339 [Jaminaea rosea]
MVATTRFVPFVIGSRGTDKDAKSPHPHERLLSTQAATWCQRRASDGSQLRAACSDQPQGNSRLVVSQCGRHVFRGSMLTHADDGGLLTWSSPLSPRPFPPSGSMRTTPSSSLSPSPSSLPLSSTSGTLFGRRICSLIRAEPLLPPTEGGGPGPHSEVLDCEPSSLKTETRETNNKSENAQRKVVAATLRVSRWQ